MLLANKAERLSRPVLRLLLLNQGLIAYYSLFLLIYVLYKQEVWINIAWLK